MKDQPELLTTREAAKRLCLSVSTLERYRVTGEGPRFRKIGRWVRYTPEDLERWLDTRARSSNADDDPEGGGARS